MGHEIANIAQAELGSTSKIIYYDRTIWRDRDGRTSLDQIGELLGRDVTREEVVVIQPYVSESEEQMRQRFAAHVKMSPTTVVIPKRAKFEDDDMHTIWIQLDPRPFIQFCKKYKVPLYQIQEGKLYDPAEKDSIKDLMRKFLRAKP